jgi:hypothetical protein
MISLGTVGWRVVLWPGEPGRGVVTVGTGESLRYMWDRTQSAVSWSFSRAEAGME